MAITPQKINFEPVSDLLAGVVVRDFPLSDITIADPSNAGCFVDGEWFTLDATGKKAARGATLAATGVDNATGRATAPCFPMWAQRGTTDVQATPDKRAPLIWMGLWEFDTRIFDASAVVASGAAITAMWQGLKVATIAGNGRNYVGLVGHGGSGDSARVQAYVSRLPADNGGKLRIRNYL
jgi:hypothetical protein